MRTRQPDYDEKPNFGTLLQKHRQLPFKRFMDAISAKLADLNDILNIPAPYDQNPGRIVPYCVSALYGPLPLTTARRMPASLGGTGFELLAPLANPATPVLPRNGNILVGRELTLGVRSISAFGFVNFGYSGTPTYDVPRPATPVGDILDDVVQNNGGAMPLDFFGGTFSTLSTPVPNLMNISFDVELYDRLRGRRLHEKRLPVELMAGGRFANRELGSEIRFEMGSNIEPRIFINEIRMGSALDATADFNAAQVKAYVMLVFKGRQYIEVPGV
jgi:hypothetical protein